MEIRKINLGKKAEVGTTMMWFVAFIIIFFLMFIYVIATGWLATKKYAVREGNSLKLNPGDVSGDLSLTRNVLDLDVEGEKSVKALIFEGANYKKNDENSNANNHREKIENEIVIYFSELISISSNLDSKKRNCLIFYASYGSKEDLVLDDEENRNVDSYLLNSDTILVVNDLTGIDVNKVLVYNRLKYISGTSLFFEDNEIILKAYQKEEAC